MGSRGPVGRKNLPSSLRLVDVEDDGHRRVPSAADLAVPRAPERPADLPDDLCGLWDLVTAELDQSGLLSRVDGMALQLALMHFRAAKDAALELAGSGSTLVGGSGGPVKNPASQVFKENTVAFVELAKQLGLTFAARARIVVAEPKSDELSNPFVGVMSG